METKTTVIPPEALERQAAICGEIQEYWQAQGVTPLAYVDTYDSTAPIPEEAWDLEAYHDRYIAGEHSFMTDCRYILSATRMICHSVPELVTCPAKVVC